MVGRDYNPHAHPPKVPPKPDNTARGRAVEEDVSSAVVMLTLTTVAEKQPETEDSAQSQYREMQLSAKKLTSHATCDLLADSLLHVMKDKQKAV